MSIHTILSQEIEKLDKQVRPYFTTEYLICADCKHSYESHYWNGGGRQEASGYDSCLVDGCKCKYAEKTETKIEYDEESINRFKSFYRSFATRIVEEAKKEERERIKQQIFHCNKCKTEYTMGMFYDDVEKIDYGTKLQKMKGDL